MPTEKEMTPEEAGRELRQMAELTAKYSGNWENFETIAVSMIKQAFDGGKRT